jgi:hypothetical protein
MSKKWLKFECENCNKENWLHEDIDELRRGEFIVYCCNCGYVKGQADHVGDSIDNESAWLFCLPFTGFERKLTRGPVGPGEMMTAETRWGVGDQSGQGLTRTEYMKERGFDPWTDWCSRFPNKKICQNDGRGRSFADRCKSRERPKQVGKPTVDRPMV